MSPIIDMDSHTSTLAVGDLFSSGTSLLYSVEAFLAVVALVVGTVAAIGQHRKEGAGSGITAQMGVIVFAVMIFLSAGIAAAITHEFERNGLGNPVNVPVTLGPVMADASPAKVYSDQRDLPIYLGDSGDGFTLPFKEKWRAPDAAAAVGGFILTGGSVTAHLDGGNALIILILGVALTSAAVWLLAKLPHHRPSAGDAAALVVGRHPAAGRLLTSGPHGAQRSE